jgi:RNA polymerase sigma-70 factor, ECF subfamily
LNTAAGEKTESSPDSTSLTTERSLIETARSDPAAFGQLYEQNFDRIYAYLARRVSTREEAQDLTSEVFHQALASLATYEFRGRPFIAWLLGIAANVLAQRWRTARHQEVSTDELELAGENSDVEDRAVLARILDELPSDQRRVILRRFIEQRTIREIANELNRSEGAIKQLQLRGLQNLRKQIRSRYE